MAVTLTSLLTETQLEAFRSRAAGYDRDNKFFQEDFDELKKAGYLKMAVPSELGGLGFKLAEVARETRRVAMYAPATALGTNMHNYWVGLAADLWRGGDKSLEWLLREAASGEVFAAGHAEPGNDLPLLLSTTKAERVDGGWAFTGRKSFGSLTPVWTRLGVHGMDTSNPSAPKIVHGFLPRNTPGITIKETWDVLGMRATRSDDTVLERAVCPDKYIGRIVPAGAAGIDGFVIGIFAWALLNFGNVYYGLASRVRDLIVEMVKSKGSLGMTRSMAYHPEVQHGIAEITMELEIDPCAAGVGRRRLVQWRGPWRELADQARLGQAQGRHRRVGNGRQGDGPVRRFRHVQETRDRAPVPRRESRTLPPGQSRPVTRTRRQADARDQSGRTASLGIRTLP